MAKSGTSSRKTSKAASEPCLGIFWLVRGKLLIDSAPLSECEQYGDHLNYPGSHIRVWERWQKVGIAPVESEYEEYARGRVMCDMKAKTFTLLADRCILNRKDLIAAIRKEFHLPKVGIPVKVNADSSGKANGVPGKANSRRSEATLAVLIVPEGVRLRQWRTSEGKEFFRSAA